MWSTTSFTSHRKGTWIPGEQNPLGLITPTRRPFIKAPVPARAKKKRKPATKTMRKFNSSWDTSTAGFSCLLPACLVLGRTMGERPISRLQDKNGVPSQRPDSRAFDRVRRQFANEFSKPIRGWWEKIKQHDLMCAWKSWTSKTLLYLASLHWRRLGLLVSLYNPAKGLD